MHLKWPISAANEEDHLLRHLKVLSKFSKKCIWKIQNFSCGWKL